MEFRIPEKGETSICKECQKLDNDRYNKCTEPCSWLISWCCNEQRTRVIRHIQSNHNWGGGNSGA